MRDESKTMQAEVREVQCNVATSASREHVGREALNEAHEDRMVWQPKITKEPAKQCLVGEIGRETFEWSFCANLDTK